MDGYVPGGVARMIDDLDFARRHDEERHVALAHREQRLPAFIGLRYGVRTGVESSELTLVERGEGDRQEIVFRHAIESSGWRRSSEGNGALGEHPPPRALGGAIAAASKPPSQLERSGLDRSRQPVSCA